MQITKNNLIAADYLLLTAFLALCFLHGTLPKWLWISLLLSIAFLLLVLVITTLFFVTKGSGKA